jgi:hypothetical protein
LSLLAKMILLFQKRKKQSSNVRKISKTIRRSKKWQAEPKGRKLQMDIDTAVR